MKYKNTYLVISIILSLLGLLMIYFASCIWAKYKTGNEYYYLIRQSIFFIFEFIFYSLFIKFHIISGTSMPIRFLL